MPTNHCCGAVHSCDFEPMIASPATSTGQALTLRNSLAHRVRFFLLSARVSSGARVDAILANRSCRSLKQRRPGPALRRKRKQPPRLPLTAAIVAIMILIAPAEETAINARIQRAMSGLLLRNRRARSPLSSGRSDPGGTACRNRSAASLGAGTGTGTVCRATRWTSYKITPGGATSRNVGS